MAFAHKPGEIYAMDFSSKYHFTENQKSKTRLRRVKRIIEELAKYTEFAEKQTGAEYKAIYEIWCFLPPNNFVTETITAAQKEGLPVKLVSLEEVHERIKQVALLEPLKRDMIYENAFLWAATLFREAGAWK